MKTMKTFLAVVVASVFSVSAMASGNLKVNISAGTKDFSEVEISNAKMSMYEIDVKNDKGKETQAPALNYKRMYDFSLLDDGTYFFRVKMDKESHQTKFIIKNGKMNVLEEKKTVEPVFVFENNQLKLTYLNFVGENTTLTVYGNYRDQVYQKDLSSDFVTQHGLDFSKATRGTYEAVLSSGNEVYSFNIVID